MMKKPAKSSQARRAADSGGASRVAKDRLEFAPANLSVVRPFSSLPINAAQPPKEQNQGRQEFRAFLSLSSAHELKSLSRGMEV
jgi:hypothetical protein